MLDLWVGTLVFLPRIQPFDAEEKPLLGGLLLVRLLRIPIVESLQYMIPILAFSTAPGACGGVTLFLFSLRMGHYKNNKYTKKLLIELLGAMLVASFVGPLFPEKSVVYASFATGLSWATIIQIARSKITKMVKAAIGEEAS